MSQEPYATISHPFSLPIDLTPGTEISIRAKPSGESYRYTLRLKVLKSGLLSVKLTDPPGDTYRLQIDLQRGTVGLMTPIPASKEFAQDLIMVLMRNVCSLSRRIGRAGQVNQRVTLGRRA